MIGLPLGRDGSTSQPGRTRAPGPITKRLNPLDAPAPGRGGGYAAPTSSSPDASSATTVPLSPRRSAGVSSIEPIAAKPPAFSTNAQAAFTFGPIDPSANGDARSASGVARRIAR